MLTNAENKKTIWTSHDKSFLNAKVKRLNGKRLGNTFNNLMKTSAQEYISSQKRNQDVWPHRSATKYTWKHVNRAYKIDNMLLFEILAYI